VAVKVRSKEEGITSGRVKEVATRRQRNQTHVGAVNAEVTVAEGVAGNVVNVGGV